MGAQKGGGGPVRWQGTPEEQDWGFSVQNYSIEQASMTLLLLNKNKKFFTITLSLPLSPHHSNAALVRSLKNGHYPVDNCKFMACLLHHAFSKDGCHTLSSGLNGRDINLLTTHVHRVGKRQRRSGRNSAPLLISV